MKGLGLFIMLLISGHLSIVNAQSKLNSDIIGEWRAVKVYDIGAVIPDGSKKQIENFQTKFINSKFTFKADHNFSFDTPFTEMTINNGHWKILEDNGEVVIQEWKDKDKERPVLMGITVLVKDGKTIFMMEETFFAFEMEKVK
jgi:hypothetical protein